MMRTLRPTLDRVLRRAPLGVQFRDALDQRVVANGLQVELHDAQRPTRPLRLQASPSGVFVAHALPGHTGFDAPQVSSPEQFQPDRFRLSVRDPMGRYVATSMAVNGLVDGLFAPACVDASPSADSPPHVPLYSAATRPLPGAMAVLRADLRLASNQEQPASWAWLELWLGNLRLASGVADVNGSLLLLCPLPTPREPTRRNSPPVGFERMSWDVSLRGYWDPARRTQGVPDLCALRAQPEIDLLSLRVPATALATLQLRAGTPLIVASANSSFLFVAA
jgi:hypothetical protein